MDRHESNRKKLCVICCASAKRLLTQDQVKAIRDYLIEDYSTDNRRLPCGVCNTCRVRLDSMARGDLSQPIYPFFNFGPMATFRFSRNLECDCLLCEKAKVRHTFGASSTKRKVGRPSSSSASQKGHRLCSLCLTPLAPGVNHSCSRTSRIKNAMRSFSPQTMKRRVGDYLAGLEEPTEVATRGRPFKVAKVAKTPNDAREESPRLSHMEMNKMRMANGPSGRQTLRVASEIRSVFGRNSIQPNLPAHLTSQNSLFSDFFSKKTILVKGRQHPVVFCTDVVGFIAKINSIRGCKPDLIKIGIDSGRGSLKITLSLVESQRGPSRKDFLSSSVKKIFIISLGLQVDESYEAIQELWNILKLDLLDKFIVNADLKCMNLLLGMTSHASLYPCPYCTSFSKHNPWASEELQLRSLQGLRDCNQEWVDAGGRGSELMKFYNVKHQPLLGKTGLVLNWFSPAPLHLILGITNRLYKKLLAVYPRAEEWASKAP